MEEPLEPSAGSTTTTTEMDRLIAIMEPRINFLLEKGIIKENPDSSLLPYRISDFNNGQNEWVVNLIFLLLFPYWLEFAEPTRRILIFLGIEHFLVCLISDFGENFWTVMKNFERKPLLSNFMLGIHNMAVLFCPLLYLLVFHAADFGVDGILAPLYLFYTMSIPIYGFLLHYENDAYYAQLADSEQSQEGHYERLV